MTLDRPGKKSILILLMSIAIAGICALALTTVRASGAGTEIDNGIPVLSLSIDEDQYRQVVEVRTVLYSVCGMPCDPAGKPASVWLQKQDGYYEYHYQSQGHGEQRTCLFDLDERAVNMLETSVIAQAAEPWDRYSGGQALLAALERGSGQPEAYVRPDAG